MKIFNLIERPSALPAALAPVSAECATWLMRVDVPQVPQVHQVQAVNPTQTVVLIDGRYGISGFTAKDVPAGAKKRLDVRGVPPRGRPV
ncbi:hypothetical protein K1W54_19800 [Micromonospora sp. CPCC 205371]|nr:hypothetical protein [Micromonospora sp. CPCC 205371]